jgi:hypothetical protein
MKSLVMSLLTLATDWGTLLVAEKKASLPLVCVGSAVWTSHVLLQGLGSVSRIHGHKLRALR